MALPRLAGLLAGLLLLAACAPVAPPAVETTDPRVTVGASRSCEELDLSAIRCTLVTLRAVNELDAARPGHARVVAQQLHAPGAPRAGQASVPSSQTVAAVIVFTLADGTRVGVPVICPTTGSESDEACNPRVE